jgi:hypothetical protein
MEYGYCQVLSSKSEGNIYNTASVINPQGVVTRYRKCFHFILMKQVTPGYITACLTYQMLQDLECLFVMICGFQKPLERGNNGCKLFYILH